MELDKSDKHARLGLSTTLLYAAALNSIRILKMFQLMNPCCHTTAETTASNKSKTEPESLGCVVNLGVYQSAKCGNTTRAATKTWVLDKRFSCHF